MKDSENEMLKALIHSYRNISSEADYILETIMDVCDIPRNNESAEDLKQIINVAGSIEYKATRIKAYALTGRLY